MIPNKTFIFFTFLAAGLCLLSACGVTSRYRLDLFVASEDARRKVDVEQTEFVQGAVLADPFLDIKYAPGAANVAVATVGTRWDAQETTRFRLLGFDQYWRCRLYLELPEPLEAGERQLSDNSFLQLMGRYDLDPEDKIFHPESGTFSIDSVGSKEVYISIGGRYLNRSHEPLEFTGQFKVKRTD